MKYYKVVRKVQNRLFSCIIRPFTEMCVEYALNEWSESKVEKFGYGLFVFDSLEAAEGFLTHEENEGLFEVEVEGVYDELPAYLRMIPDRLTAFEREVKSNKRAGNFPKHTVMVKKVKLIKRIL